MRLCIVFVFAYAWAFHEYSWEGYIWIWQSTNHQPLWVLYTCPLTWDLDRPRNAHSWTLPHSGRHVPVSNGITIFFFFPHHNLILIKIPSLERLSIARDTYVSYSLSYQRSICAGVLARRIVLGETFSWKGLCIQLWSEEHPISTQSCNEKELQVSHSLCLLFSKIKSSFLSLILLSSVPCCENASNLVITS